MSFRCAWAIPILQKVSPQLAGRKTVGSYFTYFSGSLRPYTHPSLLPQHCLFGCHAWGKAVGQTALCTPGHRSSEMLNHTYTLSWKPQSSRHTLFANQSLLALEKISHGPKHHLGDPASTHHQQLGPQGETNPGSAACGRLSESPIPDAVSPASPTASS